MPLNDNQMMLLEQVTYADDKLFSAMGIEFDSNKNINIK